MAMPMKSLQLLRDTHGVSQPAFTCLNLTIETLEQGVKLAIGFLVSLLLTLNIFHILFWCFYC